MKIKILLILLLGVLSLGKVYAANEVPSPPIPTPSSAAIAVDQVNSQGRYFKGPGVEIEMAVFTDKNSLGLQDVLLKLKGKKAFEESIEGRVLRYKATRDGSDVNYQYSEEGHNFTRLSSHDIYGTVHFNVFFGDQKIGVDELDQPPADADKPVDLLKAYQQSQ